MNPPHVPAVDMAAVESARYALVRRLGHVFRHHLVVNLQPLGMACQVMRFRLNAAPVDVAAIGETVEQVQRLVRASIESSGDVVAWLNGAGPTDATLGSTVNECLANVRSSLSFRGFVIRYDDAPANGPVSHVALREVLTAALIAITDHAQGKTDIAVKVTSEADAAIVALTVRAGPGESSAEQNAYRLMSLGDVESLASFHGLRLLHDSSGSVRIRIAHAS